MSVGAYASYRDSGVEWLGNLPSHWPVKPMKAVTSCNDEVLSEATAADYELDYVEISDVQAGQGITGSTTYMFGDAPSRARRKLRDGDVLVSTVRTYLRAIAQVRQPEDNMIASTGFAVLRPRTAHSDFLGYAIQYEGTINQIIARSVGVSYPAINASDLVRIPVPVPPLAEQVAIAAFLDRETGKIDALVEAQRQLIELLKEKRQAVISHAVTKGLDPTAPMKESGVEWLGEVPAHWEVKPLKRITDSCCDGPFGSGLKSEHYVDEGARVVRLQNIKSDGFFEGDGAFVDLTYAQAQLARHEVQAGDVLVAGLGDENNLVGRACVAPDGIEPAIVKADCFRIRLAGNHAVPKFVAAQLNASAPFDAGRLANGSTRSRIPLSVMMERAVAVPPNPEQSEIVAALEQMTQAFAEMTSSAEAAVTLLNERRSALISAAVTGKIDVRGLSVLETEAA